MPGGGTLRITTEQVVRRKGGLDLSPPAEYVVLTIADTGRGIPAADRDKIFEPFFTTKDDGQGTGLGLAVSNGIVKDHDGWIEVDSPRGGGAVFRVFLPVWGRGAGATIPPAEPRPPAETRVHDACPGHVDRQGLIRLGCMADSHAHTASVSSDSPEATPEPSGGARAARPSWSSRTTPPCATCCARRWRTTASRSRPPRAAAPASSASSRAASTWSSPTSRCRTSTGSTCCARSRRSSPSPHVITITAFGSIDTAIRAVKLGAYDYITKPFEIDQLILPCRRRSTSARCVRRWRGCATRSSAATAGATSSAGRP